MPKSSAPSADSESATTGSPTTGSATTGSATKSGIGDLLAPIEAALRAATEFDDDCPLRLAEAMRYAVLAPGKRLRPALVLMAAEACGGSFDQVLPGGVAVEFIHAYSLIHDDLPAMDDDDVRRGRPTVHIEFDEPTAILAGDALLALAFEHLSRHVGDPVRAIEGIRVLSRAAGPSRLVGGQADDLAAESRELARPTSDQAESIQPARDPVQELVLLESIHRRKTGALIAASLELGAILSGAGSEPRRVLGDYAKGIGLAFQIVDDLLDFTAEGTTLGKRAGKDAVRGKLTYPGLLGIEAARARAQELVESAQQQISIFGSAGWRLIWLANYVLERTH